MKEIIYFDWKGNQSECTTKLWVVQICDLHLFWEAFALWRMKNAINAIFTDIESRFLNVRLFDCPSRYKMVMPLQGKYIWLTKVLLSLFKIIHDSIKKTLFNLLKIK